MARKKSQRDMEVDAAPGELLQGLVQDLTKRLVERALEGISATRSMPPRAAII